ncbi:MAG TPA: prepilin-type N-terminal cleavage/methylation domain-containing protein [Bacilli bacterium]|nr:prepilin-type N-terminal cleavage/methylation domain-containing protein [Bacilli bacterium]
MNNKKGFSLVELLVSVAIVAALSIYFYKIIYILNVKYHEVEKEKNNIVNEIYITKLVYNALENGWDITASDDNDNITFTKVGETTKVIEISNMTITADTIVDFSALPANENIITLNIEFDGEQYPINVYYYN